MPERGISTIQNLCKDDEGDMMTEGQAVEVVRDAGKKYGYGNVIAHLGKAWAQLLIADGMPKKEAVGFVSERRIGPYSIE